MIVQEWSSLGGCLRSPGALVMHRMLSVYINKLEN